jgi:hypothetical protein
MTVQEPQFPRIDFTNIGLFAISYDAVDALAAFSQRYGITFPLLSDAGSRVIRELGMLNERVVEIAPIDALEVGELEGPEPRPFRVAGLDEQFVVYEGTTRFGLPLTFVRKMGDQTLDVTIRYQECSATECFMPRTVRLQSPTRAESNVERDE